MCSRRQVVAGMEQGITQVASVPAGSQAKIVWNFPLELTLKSTNVHGWPQIVIEVHGTDFLYTIRARPTHHAAAVRARAVPSPAVAVADARGGTGTTTWC